MHILNLMQCTNLGGMEQASLKLMRGLLRRGHSCHVVSLNPLGKLAESLSQSGITAEGVRYAGRGGWKSLPDLWSRLKRICPRPDASAHDRPQSPGSGLSRTAVPGPSGARHSLSPRRGKAKLGLEDHLPDRHPAVRNHYLPLRLDPVRGGAIGAGFVAQGPRDPVLV